MTDAILQSLERVLASPSEDSWKNVLEQILLTTGSAAGKILHFQPHPVPLIEQGTYSETHQSTALPLHHGRRLMGQLILSGVTSPKVPAVEWALVCRILGSAIALSADLQRFEELMKGALHDLRGPASRTTQLAELALASDPPEAIRKPLALMQAEVSKIEPLIRDLGAHLRAAVPQGGNHASKWSDIRYRLNVMLRKLALGADVNLTFAGEETTLPAHEEEVAAWLLRLVENSLKYGGDGVSVKVEVTNYEGGVLISTEDNGVGVEPAYMDRLFHPFSRLHGGVSDGHGLGLSIVSTAVQARGGRCWAEHVDPKGLRINIWLPGSAR